MAQNEDEKKITFDIKFISDFIALLRDFIKILKDASPVARVNLFMELLVTFTFVVVFLTTKPYLLSLDFAYKDFLCFCVLVFGIVVLVIFYAQCFRYCKERMEA